MTKPVHYRLDGFPPTDIKWEFLVPLIGEARAALARYDGLLAAVPNANVLLSPLLTQEAVLSSKIEGTNVTMSEVLEIEAGSDDKKITQPKRDDSEEVLNYRRALIFAAEALTDRPISLHLLREAHTLLMEGVRGRNKSPGAFRTRQNWIGSPGCTMDEADFVPIPQEHLLMGLDRWSDYVQVDGEIEPLVQLAIIHAEFEALHPFEDGNGRLGRMIIPLFLYARDILSSPNFYMSGYLEARRDEYMEALRRVSRDGAWAHWCIFFLEGLIRQARENQAKARAILDLHQDMLHRVADSTRSRYSSRAVEFLFSRPVFVSTGFVENAGIPRATAQRLLLVLRQEQMLQAIVEGGGRKPTIYAFPKLLEIAEEWE